MSDATQAAPDPAPAARPVVELVIEIERRRIPGDFVVRPWFCIVSCPGKPSEPAPRRLTRDAAGRAGFRIAKHLASGRPFRVVWR